MNHAYIRPGGVVQDLPPGALEAIRAFLDSAPELVHELRTLIDANPIFIGRTKGVAYLDLAGCMALGVTGPMLRSAGLPWDLRKSQPYCGYETLRLRGAGQRHVRRVRPVPDQDRRDRGVAARSSGSASTGWRPAGRPARTPIR